MDAFFIIAPQHRQAGSSYLRGEQLCQLCRWLLDGTFRVADTTAGLFGATLVLTKWFLLNLTTDQADDLRRAGNRLIADYLDAEIDAAVAERMDILISSSRTQDRFLRARFPQIPVLPVTHHVDLRLPDVHPSQNRFAVGYFGELHNAVGTSALVHRIHFHAAGNPQDTRWFAELPRFNCHWAVRRMHQRDAFKPFTKGFIAAHCASPVIVQADNAEAIEWLGPDYPFIATSDRRETLLAMLDLAAGSFGGPLWSAALARMRIVQDGCAPRLIAGQLRQVFRD